MNSAAQSSPENRGDKHLENDLGSESRPRLSLVFPAFNEAKNLPALLESATKIGDTLGAPFEIVIVDDGSQDESAAVVDGWKDRDPRIVSVHHATNLGYGAALRAGLREARGDLVFFSDADLQFDLNEMAHLLEHAEEVEIVAGYRAPRRDPWVRSLIAWVWGALVRVLFGLPIRDIDCAFKVFRREVLDEIPIESIGAFINTEILVRARTAGFRIRQIPVTHLPRRSGRQTGANPRVILRALVELAQLYGELHPLRKEKTRRADSSPVSPSTFTTTAPPTAPSTASQDRLPRRGAPR